MKKYVVTIEKRIEIEAESENDAVEKAEAVFEDFSDDDLGIEPEYSVEEIVEAENE